MVLVLKAALPSSPLLVRPNVAAMRCCNSLFSSPARKSNSLFSSPARRIRLLHTTTRARTASRFLDYRSTASRFLDYRSNNQHHHHHAQYRSQHKHPYQPWLFEKIIRRTKTSLVLDAPSFKVAKIQLHPDDNYDEEDVGDTVAIADNKNDDTAPPTTKTTRMMDKMLKFQNMHTTDLLREANIYARDLLTLNVTSRQENLEPRFAQRTPAAIVPRGNLILVSFGNVRAVVGLDQIHVLDAHRPAVQDFARDIARVLQLPYETQEEAYAHPQPFQEPLLLNNVDGEEEATYIDRNDRSNDQDRNLQQHSRHRRHHHHHHHHQPHELVFLEGLLRDTVESFNRRVQLYEPIIEDFLGRVSDEVYSDTGVHQLAPLKESLQSFEMQVKQSVECLAALLDDDEAMLQLLLTEQYAAQQLNEEVDFARHEHVELLLGVYARQMSMILMEIQFLLSRLQSKQEFIALALDSYRNRLVRINVILSIFGLSLAVGTTVAGYFGMNLVSGLEADPVAFAAVVSGTSLVGVGVALISLNYISGSTLKRRAEQRLQEIETLSGALSDMCALDYTLKRVVEKEREQERHDQQHLDDDPKKYKPVDKAEFKELVKSARRSRTISDREVNLLFRIFDRVKDGVITTDDLTFLEVMRHSSADAALSSSVLSSDQQSSRDPTRSDDETNTHTPSPSPALKPDDPENMR